MGERKRRTRSAPIVLVDLWRRDAIAADVLTGIDAILNA
jgi:hypothetical protein